MDYNDINEAKKRLSNSDYKKFLCEIKKNDKISYNNLEQGYPKENYFISVISCCINKTVKISLPFAIYKYKINNKDKNTNRYNNVNGSYCVKINGSYYNYIVYVNKKIYPVKILLYNQIYIKYNTIKITYNNRLKILLNIMFLSECLVGFIRFKNEYVLCQNNNKIFLLKRPVFFKDKENHFHDWYEYSSPCNVFFPYPECDIYGNIIKSIISFLNIFGIKSYKILNGLIVLNVYCKKKILFKYNNYSKKYYVFLYDVGSENEIISNSGITLRKRSTLGHSKCGYSNIVDSLFQYNYVRLKMIGNLSVDSIYNTLMTINKYYDVEKIESVFKIILKLCIYKNMEKEKKNKKNNFKKYFNYNNEILYLKRSLENVIKKNKQLKQSDINKLLKFSCIKYDNNYIIGNYIKKILYNVKKEISILNHYTDL